MKTAGAIVALWLALVTAHPTMADELDLSFDNSPVTKVLDHIGDYGAIGIAYSPTKLNHRDGTPIRVTIRMKVDAKTALKALAEATGCIAVTLGKDVYAFKLDESISTALPQTETEKKLIGAWVMVDDDVEPNDIGDMKLNPDGTCHFAHAPLGGSNIRGTYHVIGSYLFLNRDNTGWSRRIVTLTDSELILELKSGDDVTTTQYKRAK